MTWMPEYKPMNSPPLLTRDQFREAVFKRDDHRCVARHVMGSFRCPTVAADAHHIIERRLFPDGGYYLNNGASLCEEHHIAAEQTRLGCDALREWLEISRPILPPHLYDDQPYDKWGNPILPNGTRLRGELFWDESVQKILGEGGMLSLFTNRVKYPRTYHLPWSPGLTKDDRMMDKEDPFAGQEVVVTIKQDGENTTMYKDYLHERSLTYEPHITRNWVKALHGKIAYEIPEDWRICGENLYAKHSIHYKNLEDWFQMFSIWNERNICLSWDETDEYAQLFGFTMPPVIYRGPGDRRFIDNLYTPTYNGDPCEGYVVRSVEAFPYSEFRYRVGKYVRKGHVQAHGHWLRQAFELNGLSDGNTTVFNPNTRRHSARMNEEHGGGRRNEVRGTKIKDELL